MPSMPDSMRQELIHVPGRTEDAGHEDIGPSGQDTFEHDFLELGDALGYPIDLAGFDLDLVPGNRRCVAPEGRSTGEPSCESEPWVTADVDQVVRPPSSGSV